MKPFSFALRSAAATVALALTLTFVAAPGSLHSQAPAPGTPGQPRMIPGVAPLPAPAPASTIPVTPGIVAPAPVVPLPVQATPAGVLTQLRIVRDQNAKLIEQQAITLKQLEEMEKTSQTLKMLGKRS